MRHDRSDTNIYNGINAAILVTIACVAVLAAVTVLPSAAGLSAVVVHSRDVSGLWDEDVSDRERIERLTTATQVTRGGTLHSRGLPVVNCVNSISTAIRYSG